MLVLTSAGICGGSAPIRVGCTAVAVYQTGNLDRAADREIVDQMVVGHIAVDHPWFPRLDATDDRRGIFEAPVHFDRTVAFESDPFFVPFGDLRDASPRVLVERDVESLDQIRVCHA